MGLVIRSLDHNNRFQLHWFKSQGEAEHHISSLSSPKEIDVWFDQDQPAPITTGNIEVVGPYTPIHNGKRILPILNN